MENIKGREYTSEDIQDLPPYYEDQVYSPLELEELDKFTHIHEQIDQVEEHIDQNLGWFANVPEGEKPKKENLVFTMDPRLNWYLHIIAFNMYKEFSGNEKMREAADSFLNGRRIGKQMSEEFEKRELQNLWETL